jgi:hypothetical protein
LRAKGFYVHPWPWWWSLIGSMSTHGRDDEAWLALCPPMAVMMKLDWLYVHPWPWWWSLIGSMSTHGLDDETWLALCPPMALMIKAGSPLEYPRKDMCLFHVFKCN